jgi:4-hydroxy-tetrahydrodipicolinate synthase
MRRILILIADAAFCLGHAYGTVCEVVRNIQHDHPKRNSKAPAMNKTDFELNGLVVPVPAPFAESGAIDFGAFLAHLDWLAECGVRNLLINGTTGEFFSLSPREQLDLLKVARENWDGMIVAHTGSPVLFQCLESAHAAEEIGADFLASLPPFYFAGAPADGLVRWFNELAKSTELPLILYNFPKHTGNPLTPEILSQIPHYGMKDSSADLSLIPSTPRYFVGGDRNISAAYAAGAKGFVSASANMDPEIYLRIEREQSAENQAAVDAVNERTSGPFAIARIKMAISEIIPGYPSHVRLPLMTSQ